MQKGGPLDSCGRRVRRIVRVVTSAQRPGGQEPRVEYLDPEDALRRAKPLPPREELEIEDVTVGEAEAFFAALTDR